MKSIRRAKRVMISISVVLVIAILCQILFLSNLFAGSALSLDEQLSLHKTELQKNNYPIIFVPGFMGWGKEELCGYSYWGGTNDIVKFLNNSGYEAYEAVVGPLSSNWDRACELYAYIKGGTVDYGQAHSEKAGHNRYGSTFKGVYQDFGTVNATTGETNKVHLVCHSMGGPTARLLVQLLEQGYTEEMEVGSDSKVSPLFTGNHSYVDSITTIASPLDGTSLVGPLDDFIVLIKSFVAANSVVNGFFDFKLDQWGLGYKKNEETYSEYVKRIYNSKIWKDTKDICAWDLSPEGSSEMNGWVKAQPSTYYFSWATECTRKSIFSSHQVPERKMNLELRPSGLIVGSRTVDKSSIVRIDSSWWQSDGVINTVSQDYPKLNSKDKMRVFDGTAQKGVWNSMGIKESSDHFVIVGRGLKCTNKIAENIRSLYVEHAKVLRSLEK